jgi:hypothetical protein
MQPILFRPRIGNKGAIPWRGGLSPLPSAIVAIAGPISLADNCIFTPTTGGLTDWSAAAPVLGSSMPIEAGCIIGNRYHYAARSADQMQWEGGLGTCRGEYISRDTVLWSSNGGLPVNFSVIPTVSLDAIADDFRWRRNQRSVITTPIVILPNDQVLNCNMPGPAACQLPPSASRNGIPLTFKIVGGNPNIIFTFSGFETADGQVLVSVTASFGGITFVPFADGVNIGWSIE